MEDVIVAVKTVFKKSSSDFLLVNIGQRFIYLRFFIASPHDSTHNGGWRNGTFPRPRASLRRLWGLEVPEHSIPSRNKHDRGRVHYVSVYTVHFVTHSGDSSTCEGHVVNRGHSVGIKLNKIIKLFLVLSCPGRLVPLPLSASLAGIRATQASYIQTK